MVRLTSLLFLAGCCSITTVLGGGFSWPAAQKTLPVGGRLASPLPSETNYGGAPAPTEAPSAALLAELLKRDAPPTSVCGLLQSNTSYSWTCNNNYFCGFNDDRSAFGCCSGYTNGALQDCYVPTSCIDYATTSIDCADTSSCQVNNYYCTESAYPYCGAFVEGALTAFGCFDEPSLTYDLIGISQEGGAGGSVTSTSTSGSSSFSSLSSITSITSISSSTSSSYSYSSTTEPTTSFVPFTESQQAIGSGDSQPSTSMSVSTIESTALAVGMGTTNEKWYGLWMSFFLLFI